jgi:hypothetical protein
MVLAVTTACIVRRGGAVMQHRDRRSRVLMLGLLAVLLVWLGPSPAAALVAVIEIAAPVEGASDDDLRAALQSALGTALSGAEAMGLPGVHLLSAGLEGRTLTIRVMAADALLAGTDDPVDRSQHRILPASLPPGDALSPRGALWLCEPRSPRLAGH